jgi:hypothetical protein
VRELLLVKLTYACCRRGVHGQVPMPLVSAMVLRMPIWSCRRYEHGTRRMSRSDGAALAAYCRVSTICNENVVVEGQSRRRCWSTARRHQTARGQASLSGKFDMCRWRTLHRGRGFSCPAMRVHQGLGPPKRRWRTCIVDDLPGTGGTRDQTVRHRQRGRRAGLCCEPRWMRIGTASVVQDWDLVLVGEARGDGSMLLSSICHVEFTCLPCPCVRSHVRCPNCMSR